MLPHNLAKLKAKEYIEARVIAANEALINAQIILATGQTFLYKIEKEYVPAGKFGNKKEYWKNKKPVIVTDQNEIEDYLSGLIENGDMDDEYDSSATYYYMTTKEPNNEAIKDLQNRVHGKPKESLEVDVDVKFSLRGLADNRKGLLNDPKMKKIQSKLITNNPLELHE